MLLDTRTGLRELQVRLKAFVVSPVDTASFAAETTGSPAPYDEFLGGLRVQKRSGEASLILAADRWLELSASTDSHTSTRSTRATGHLHLRRKPTGRCYPIRTAVRLIKEWATAHRPELEANWNRLKAGEPLERIAPLD